MSLQLSFAQASATGPREENQDALRLVTPAPELAASKGYLFALADGVSQCADGGLAARASLQARPGLLRYPRNLERAPGSRPPAAGAEPLAACPR